MPSRFKATSSVMMMLPSNANEHTQRKSLSDDVVMMKMDEDDDDDEDDSDIDSVQDVDMVCRQAYFEKSTQPSKKKRVRIAPEPQILAYIETLEEITDDDRQELWWQKEEYESTKGEARTMCRTIRKMSDSGTSLNDAMDRASMMASSGLELHVIHSNQVLTPNTGLIKWCSAMEGRRGLERWSCKLHGMVRSKLVGEVKHAVLLEQARQFLSNQRNCEALGALAEVASRKSRAFAALLGQADAIAADAERAGPVPRPIVPAGPPQKSLPSKPHDSIADDMDEDPSEEERASAGPVVLMHPAAWTLHTM